MAPSEDLAVAASPPEALQPQAQPNAIDEPQTAKQGKSLMSVPTGEIDDWGEHVDEVSQQIHDIINGTITDFDEFDRTQGLKARAKQIKEEEFEEKKKRFFLFGQEGKGEGKRYKNWCKRCFVEYLVDLDENKCTRCHQSDKMMTQEQRREELMGKLDVFKETKVKHQFRKDKWLRWKKTQSMLKRSKNVNYKAWEYWEPDTESDEEGDPIVPKDNPEFLAMEADMKKKHKKTSERAKTAHKMKERGNECMKEGDFISAIENYEEALEYKRDNKAIWTNKALAEIKVFRYHDAILSCNKVIEYSEIFEDGFSKSPDACFKAFMRRGTALRGLHKWDEAVEDFEDALLLFPKDRDAKTLLSKTKAAAEEAKLAEGLHDSNDKPAPSRAKANIATWEAAAGVPEPSEEGPLLEEVVEDEGPVRVEIEESDSEEEIIPSASSDSLAGLSKQEVAKLVARLKSGPQERTLFCQRKNTNSCAYAKKDKKQRDDEGRKVVMKIEEVPDPSGLDNLLKDVERCCILFKKHQGNVVPIRSDVVKTSDPHEAAEEAAALSFTQVTVPRCLEVLFVLASSSELNCELTSNAVRHVWPFLSAEVWRHKVLELLHEWSQCSVSARALAEFASRYPEPHFRLLVEAVTQDKKENLLPPNFEEIAKAATAKLEKGDAEGGIDAALNDMMAGLTQMSAAELAVSTLGNVCVAGHPLPNFKEQVAPFCDEIVGALVRQLKPSDWRLCGRAAGTIANILRLGPLYVDAVQDRCLEPLVKALREEADDTQGPGSMRETASIKMPFVKATSRLLGALVNFIVIRPSGLKLVSDLGVLAIVVPLMEVKGQAGAASSDHLDENPTVIAARALTIASRLVREHPETIPLKLETDILCRIDRILEHECRAVGKSGREQSAFDTLDLALRILVGLLTRKEGALDRLTGKAPRCQELPEGVNSLEDMKPAVPFGKLVSRLMKLTSALKADSHMSPDDEGTATSRIRGNLALLFARLVDAQGESDASSVFQDIDFECLVEIFVNWLRKERGPVQQNVGVVLTRMASSVQYKQRVRDLNGMDSLHQIMLPKVEKQKAEANRLHRLKNESRV